MIGGNLPNFKKNNNFERWSFGNGFLWTPEGEKFTSGDIRAGKIALLEMNRLHRISVRRRKQKKPKNNVIPFPVKTHKTVSSA